MDGNQVGGDWYDVLPLPDGAVGIAVGDVVGHDLRAAAAMGQLRGVVRSYAWGGDQPGSVLDRCDQLVQGLEMAAMATAVYARLDPPAPDGTRTLHYANAGHPTPLLLDPEGELVRLDGHHSPMIGVMPIADGARAAGRERPVPPGLPAAALHGRADRRRGLRRGRAHRAPGAHGRAAPPGSDAETVVDDVLAACLPEPLRDDVALLAVRLDP